MKNLGGGLFRQSPKKIIGISVFIILIAINMINLKSRNEVLQNETEKSTLFAIYIDGVQTNQLPGKEEGYSFDEEKSFCNNDVSIKWGYKLWTANVDFTDYKLQNKERTYCNLYFKKEEYKYEYTGSVQEFIVPYTGDYKIELWGASYQERTQLGSYTSGILSLTKDTTLYLYLGEKPFSCLPYTECNRNSFNGGGIGGFFTQSNYMARTYSGSGATDVRLVSGSWDDFTSLNSRIMVAAGSGVCEGVCAGGGLVGYVGSDYDNGGAGTQTKGGKATSDATAGSFGKGGNGFISTPYLPNCNDAFGGGGGYYGGGGGRSGSSDTLCTSRYGSGGSGSSFISGHNGCVAIQGENNQSPKPGCMDGTTDIKCSIHYSGYKFENTKMIDGAGYLWTTKKEEHVGLPPNPGSSGNGYARVTYLGR